jgi:murein DD-endopeptidase MepM/ murein hydrolase activator NlpD
MSKIFMRSVVVFIMIGCHATCFSQTNGYSIHDLKDGRFKDDSSYVYSLPFENKKKVFLIQAYDSKMSHKGELALDFKVKKKTKICAARDGIVISAREDSDKGGLKPANMSDGNYISIQHYDGSVAHYWHLIKNGVLVNVGDTITKGRVIGLSGNTGYSAFPHLHFEVVGNGGAGNTKQLATRFYTNKGTVYLRPGHFYRALH